MYPDGFAEPLYRYLAGLDLPPKVPFAHLRPVRALLHSEQPDLLRPGRGRLVLIGALGLPRGPLQLALLILPRDVIVRLLGYQLAVSAGR